MMKVMNDIVSTMFNRRFIEEIFQKHQPIHSRRVSLMMMMFINITINLAFVILLILIESPWSRC